MEDTVAAANDGLCPPERTPRKPDTRFQVVRVGTDPGTASGVDAGDQEGIGLRDIVGKAVAVFPLGRGEIVGQSQSKGEIGGCLPAILKIPAILFPAAAVQETFEVKVARLAARQP